MGNYPLKVLGALWESRCYFLVSTFGAYTYSIIRSLMVGVYRDFRCRAVRLECVLLFIRLLFVEASGKRRGVSRFYVTGEASQIMSR